VKAPAKGSKKPSWRTPDERDRRDYRRAVAQDAAHLRSAWECDYRAAIAAARAGDPARLIDLLRAHRPPTDEDFDELADYHEVMAKHSRGRERNEAVHEAARLADIIMHMGEAEKEVWKLRRRVSYAARTYPWAYSDKTRVSNSEAHAWAYSDKTRVSKTERTAAIKIACAQIERELGVVVKPKQVRDLLCREKKRRQPRPRDAFAP